MTHRRPCRTELKNLIALPMRISLYNHIHVFYLIRGKMLVFLWIDGLLVAFAKLRKETIGCVMSVRLFVRPPVHMEQLGSHYTDFHKNLYLRIFRKSVEKIQMSLKSDKNKRYFTWRPIYIFLAYLVHFFLKLEILNKNVLENIKHPSCIQ